MTHLVALKQTETSPHQRRQQAHTRPGNGQRGTHARRLGPRGLLKRIPAPDHPAPTAPSHVAPRDRALDVRAIRFSRVPMRGISPMDPTLTGHTRAPGPHRVSPGPWIVDVDSCAVPGHTCSDPLRILAGVPQVTLEGPTAPPPQGLMKSVPGRKWRSTVAPPILRACVQYRSKGRSMETTLDRGSR